jgi:hypothetical protein
MKREARLLPCGRNDNCLTGLDIIYSRKAINTNGNPLIQRFALYRWTVGKDPPLPPLKRGE